MRVQDAGDLEKEYFVVSTVLLGWQHYLVDIALHTSDHGDYCDCGFPPKSRRGQQTIVHHPGTETEITD